jgi:hypothetical protein
MRNGRWSKICTSAAVPLQAALNQIFFDYTTNMRGGDECEERDVSSTSTVMTAQLGCRPWAAYCGHVTRHSMQSGMKGHEQPSRSRRCQRSQRGLKGLRRTNRRPNFKGGFVAISSLNEHTKNTSATYIKSQRELQQACKIGTDLYSKPNNALATLDQDSSGCLSPLALVHRHGTQVPCAIHTVI